MISLTCSVVCVCWSIAYLHCTYFHIDFGDNDRRWVLAASIVLHCGPIRHYKLYFATME
jgi:hypothetical protein